MPHLQLTATATGTTASLSVAGEIDLASAPPLGRRIGSVLRDRPETFILDLTAVDFLDSTCLRMLIATSHRTAAEGIRLVVIRPAGPARRALDVGELDRLVTLVDGGIPLLH